MSTSTKKKTKKVDQPTVKGYKIFNPDFTCHPSGGSFIQYKENKVFEFKGELRICKSGLHFCLKASHCFTYYKFDPNNIVCEVEALGEVQYHSEDSKACTNILKVGRRLTWAEVLVVANEGKDNTGHSNTGDSNSGDRNSGYRNSGDRNSGNWNSGDRNSGDWNSGNWNSGNWNSGDSNSGYRNSGNWNSGNWNSGNRNSGDSNSGYRNSGAFSTDPNPKLVLFDKLTDINVKDWENSEAVRTMNDLLQTNIWIYSENMSKEEKEKYPTHETTGGYLKSIPLKDAWQNMWGNLSDAKRKLFLDLPNFDADKFEEITGIKVTPTR